MKKIGEKVRQSNFELLRIIAMFMVLVLHADFQALGAPDRAELISSPMVATIKVLLEMASIVAVNVFVLISGWFGIKPSFKGFSRFVFQCLFFSIGIYSIMLLIGYKDLSIRGMADCFALFPNGYWFITSYICLYFLAPILNSFIQNTDKTTYATVLISFYLFQTIYSFLGNGANFLMRGYSALSFIGLYLLINYVKKYINYYKYSKIRYLTGYIVSTLILTSLYISASALEYDFISSRICSYSNPIVIVSAAFLLLFFAQLSISSGFINWFGASCFAVYLLHSNSNIWELYLNSIKVVVESNGWLGYLIALVVIVAWFFVAVLIDQLRLFTWNQISLKGKRYI